MWHILVQYGKNQFTPLGEWPKNGVGMALPRQCSGLNWLNCVVKQNCEVRRALKILYV